MSRPPAESRRVNRRKNRHDTPRPLRRGLDSYPDESCRVVYIAAEGEKTEPDYVNLLNDTYGQRPGRKFFLHFCHAGEGLRPSEVVSHVIAAAPSPKDEKWALFDRDTADNRDDDIRAAMRKAAREGVQVALSHPSFELWLLLHFQPFTSQEDGLSDMIKDRLRKHPGAKGFAEYDKKSGDRGKGLVGQRGQSLLGKEKAAVDHARNLVANCPYGGCSTKELSFDKIPGPRTESYEEWNRRSGHVDGCDPLKRDPSTDVWRLLYMLEIGTEPSGSSGHRP
ncbi:RloB family protein [Streptantibioticus ferralitis]|uniref:RloB family protein n=1 Tax=Streptantibioticus ferralitis TaxID=236510 RepID=A0ABT5Z1F6_9ACTN|nr:RloB family protein [Streptantibioticus ferralitis]MDF2257639.1 RloB family protein [Streptantibioticus ferralitis]